MERVEVGLGIDDGRDRIDGKLGEGGEGVTYRVTPSDGAPYALKVFRDKAKHLPIESMDKIEYLPEHDNIHRPELVLISSTNPDVEDGLGHRSLIADEDLTRAINRRQECGNPFSESEIAQAMFDVSQAVRVAAPLCHNDIKMANVFIHEDRSLLADWGTATWPSEPIPGCTMDHVDPHVFLDESYDQYVPNRKSDVYSIGAMAHKAATGKSFQVLNSNTQEAAVRELADAARDRSPLPSESGSVIEHPYLKEVVLSCTDLYLPERSSVEDLQADLVAYPAVIETIKDPQDCARIAAHHAQRDVEGSRAVLPALALSDDTRLAPELRREMQAIIKREGYSMNGAEQMRDKMIGDGHETSFSRQRFQGPRNDVDQISTINVSTASLRMLR